MHYSHYLISDRTRQRQRTDSELTQCVRCQRTDPRSLDHFPNEAADRNNLSLRRSEQSYEREAASRAFNVS